MSPRWLHGAALCWGLGRPCPARGARGQRWGGAGSPSPRGAGRGRQQPWRGATAQRVSHHRPYQADPSFDPEFIMSKSTAAAGLCSWCLNIVRFYEVYCEVEPKRLALAEANAELAEAQEKLARIKKKIAVSACPPQPRPGWRPWSDTARPGWHSQPLFALAGARCNLHPAIQLWVMAKNERESSYNSCRLVPRRGSCCRAPSGPGGPARRRRCGR